MRASCQVINSALMQRWIEDRLPVLASLRVLVCGNTASAAGNAWHPAGDFNGASRSSPEIFGSSRRSWDYCSLARGLFPVPADCKMAP